MGVLEIKTTQIMNPMQWSKWKDGIPQNYYTQCIHQLIATGYEFVIIKAQIKHGKPDDVKLTTKHYTIEKNDVMDDMEYLLEKELKFWEQVQNKVRPNLILPII